MDQLGRRSGQRPYPQLSDGPNATGLLLARSLVHDPEC